MSREKQIEEMARDICRSRFAEDAILCEECEKECLYHQIATALAAKDYRKQSEGEWIFKEEKDAFFCSLCDNEALIDASFIGIDFAIAELSDFCPHCGAKMKGGAE